MTDEEIDLDALDVMEKYRLERRSGKQRVLTP